jgi:multidrug efflux pump subunit AcrB
VRSNTAVGLQTDQHDSMARCYERPVAPVNLARVLEVKLKKRPGPGWNRMCCAEALKKNSQHFPPGVQIVLSGQVLTMNKPFQNLEIGIAAAVVFGYLLMGMMNVSWRFRRPSQDL